MGTQRSASTEGRSLTRSELKAVIRRAAELYAAEADERALAEERVTESELLRIAAELGLPATHVRQALFELPETEGLQPGGSLLDKLLGTAAVAADRAVPGEAAKVLSRLEDYLTTREYLQPLRSQPGRALYAPADDTISKVARAISRPASRHHIARANRIGVAVRPLEEGYSRVRIEADLSGHRKDASLHGSIFGGLVGLAAGGGLAVFAAPLGAEVMGTLGAVLGGTLAVGGGLASGVAGGFAIARATLRKRLDSARDEVEALLDRLQNGERLDPPPAPWRRRLQSGINRYGPPGR